MRVESRWPPRVVVAVVVTSALAGGVWLADGLGAETAFIRLSAVMFATLGLLATRQPEGRSMGWLLLAVGTSQALMDAAWGYAELGRAGAVWAYWFGQWIGLAPPVLLLILLPLLFPDGRVPSERWRFVLPTSLGVLGLGMLVMMVVPDSYTTNAGVVIGPNPLGLVALEQVLVGTFLLLALGALALSLLAFVTFVERFRAAVSVERLQLRWLLFGLTIALAFVLLTVVAAVAATLTDGVVDLPEVVVDVLGGMVFLVLPASIGIAILRYRLYEIDRVISRTVAYALVTAMLVAVYTTMVLAAQGVLGDRLGSSDLVIAASTLTVAVLFHPLRGRVQGRVDRRFNRRRYVASGTVDAFTSRLRDAIELPALSGDLRRVLADTVGPRSTAIWIAPVPQDEESTSRSRGHRS
jgi:hypothetical protein